MKARASALTPAVRLERARDMTALLVDYVSS